MRNSIVFSYSLFLAFFIGCGDTTSDPPASFNAEDVKETARWAARILGPLNSLPQSSNQIARKENLQSLKAEIKKVTDGLIGKTVSWEMDCGVSETVITLMPNNYGANGEEILGDRSYNRIAMMLLDDRSKTSEYGRPTRGDDPSVWFFQLDVPSQVSLNEAKLLPERVIMNGRIKEVEVERYLDRELEEYQQDSGVEWYLLYVYLTDVKLKPSVEQ